MKFLVLNGAERTGKDVLANCLALRDDFVYIEPYTTNEENSRIWNTPYVKADKMRVLMGENVPLVTSYVNDDIYVYFEDMMSEEDWNVLILNGDGLKQLRENADAEIVTCHITNPDCGCDCTDLSRDDFDITIEYGAFISDNAQAIEEFLKNV